MITDADREAAEMLAIQICGCANKAQRKRDIAAILEYRIASTEALTAEVERLKDAVEAQMAEKHKEAAEAKLWFDKAQEWGGENRAMTAERDALLVQAQGHAAEAATANATIYEIYQVITGSTGEPGNWHGAEPVREKFTALTARVAKLEGALCNIQYEAERENGGWIHLKRCIAGQIAAGEHLKDK